MTINIDDSVASALDNSADSIFEITVRERLPDQDILQLSFELCQSPDDPDFWATLENLSAW